MAKTAELDVLVVEDSENEARLVQRELKRSGFNARVTRVETESELRNALQRQRWHVVISDASARALDARVALAVTKSLAAGTPFIVVSGTIREELAVETLRAGAADYVTKDNLGRLGPAVARELATGETPAPEPPVAHLLLAAQEAETRRIARELHDRFGQLLTGLRLTLDAARRCEGAEVTVKLAEAIAIVDEAIQKSRELSVELSPSILDDAGLAAALHWLAERVARWSPSAIEVDAEPIERPPFAVEAACFRIAQEALTNVARHAAATRVRIELRASDGAIELVIRDDGVGFDPEPAWRRASAGDSLGLLAMRERAALIGATFELTSAPGAGTTVRVHRPRSP